MAPDLKKALFQAIRFTLVSAFILFLGVFVFSNSMSHWVAFRKPQVQREWKTERRAELLETIKRAQPLIKAIKAYEADHKKHPENLEALIPKYLKRLPEPGPAAYRQEWYYHTDDPELTGGWALQVGMRRNFCPLHPGIMSFGDFFVYHPSGKYDQSDYGGGYEPVEDWAYYHE